MQKCHTQSSCSGLRGRGALVATLAFVLLGAVGFTAAGGIEILKGWIITVEIDGEGTVTLDDAAIDVETDDTGMTTVTIDGAEIEGAEEGAIVTITAASTDDGTRIIENADGQTTQKGGPDDK